jgi:FkbM family methyltransferase
VTISVYAGRMLKLVLRMMHQIALLFVSQLPVSWIGWLSRRGLHRLKLMWILRASRMSPRFNRIDANKVLNTSRSQLGQDVLVLGEVGPDRIGFFVEFGATNGVDLSNTYLLETAYGWKGILCEPALIWQPKLAYNRGAIIDERCVWSESNLTLEFSETARPELSTLGGFGDNDGHKAERLNSHNYPVQTVSLLDLLSDHEAPKHIEFLSVDTEGSEFDILNAFDFSQYTFGTICVEHNYLENRPKVKQLLEANGYRQVYPELSEFDDWFVLKTNQNIPG